MDEVRLLMVGVSAVCFLPKFLFQNRGSGFHLTQVYIEKWLIMEVGSML